ncbi:MAG: hypothetical protein P8M80_08670 [Pirellulaceae bacterium]|nr:hypothetical protein [Pirellulaceae bacterium]
MWFTRFRLLFLLPASALFFTGCGEDRSLNGCPTDVVIPEGFQVLGSSYDTDLFVGRLQTVDKTLTEVVELLKTALLDLEWVEEGDSTTDTGGEITFIKDQRSCILFLTFDPESEKITVSLRCDRY